jgi:ankyrin repeat protein
LGRAGDFRFVNLWLEASLPLDPLDERQQTPLMVAAHAGATYMCALFVAKGADVRLQDRDGWTCLHHAVDAGHEKTVEYLCSRAVPLDAQASTNGFTALHITAFHDMRKLAALLLDAGTAARQCAGLAPPPPPGGGSPACARLPKQLASQPAALFVQTARCFGRAQVHRRENAAHARQRARLEPLPRGRRRQGQIRQEARRRRQYTRPRQEPLPRARVRRISEAGANS